MSTAIWGEPEIQPEDIHEKVLLKQLLVKMMVQFGAVGACIALHSDHADVMEVRLHLRIRSGQGQVAQATSAVPTTTHNGAFVPPVHEQDTAVENAGLSLIRGQAERNRPITVPLPDSSASAITRLKRSTQGLAMDEVEEVTSQQSDLFPVGATYTPGKDLIGYVWRKNETHIMRHEDYLAFFYAGGSQVPLKIDVVPTWYLVVPMQAPSLLDEEDATKNASQSVRGQTERIVHGQGERSIWGIAVLYQTSPGAVFQQKQRAEARDYTERIALYLQNDQLRRRQRRTSEYLRQLKAISSAFPTSVKLATLVETMHQFVSKVVDFSSMLITLYDRDTNKIYDVFAITHGQPVEDVAVHPHIGMPEERPVWWQVTQVEKQMLAFSPVQRETDIYDELLGGVWGDQTQAESFLLLPMKMFNRVIGSLCLTSTRSNAYSLPEEIQVLETMVQIITVSIENANLYDRSHKSLRDAKHREQLLAGMNSALQTISISTELNATEIMNKFVESAAQLVQAQMSVFFQLTLDQKQLIGQAAYEPARPRYNEDEPDTQIIENEARHEELFKQIRIPFEGTTLEDLVKTSFFYLDDLLANELAQLSEDAGNIFLTETGIKRMLMIPVLYQSDLIGLLGVHMPGHIRNFRPAEVGMLLALSAQAASAIRNAQLFEEVQEAYAELQHLDKLKDEFLVTASHELRTPLTAITGYSSLLRRQSNRTNPQQVLRLATKIAGAAQQLTDLMSSMIDAAKIGTVDKKLDLQFSPVPMQEVIELAVNLLSVNVEQKIETQVAQGLWINGDPLRVRQVLSNLLDNAAKYSPSDGRIDIVAEASVLSQVHVPDEMTDAESNPHMPVVVCRIYDEGESIQPEDQLRIFEKFVRAPRSLTTPVRGSGLGLYICRRYIEAMGGRIWLEQSIPGEGSVFSFYLPRIDMPEIETQSGRQALESIPNEPIQ
jgi:signal transduction histidine kinase